MTYNFDEHKGDNHYNCPVVAYYPEVLAGNCPELEGKKFIYDYVGIHRPKDFVHKMAKEVLPKYFGGISEREVQAAADAAYAEYEAHMAKIRVKGSEIIDEARRQGKRIIVLAGRPYHVDPEVNHGIDTLITRAGAAAITASPVPSCCCWMTLRCGATSFLTSSPSGAVTTTILSASMPSSVSRILRIIGLPQIGISTFGRSDFIRVPLPAPSTTAAIFELVIFFPF